MKCSAGFDGCSFQGEHRHLIEAGGTTWEVCPGCGGALHGLHACGIIFRDEEGNFFRGEEQPDQP